MIKRFLCFLLGHDRDEVAHCVTRCARCNSLDDPYGTGYQWTDFERSGFYGEVRSVFYSLTAPIRRRLWLRCHECNQWIGWRKRYDDLFCSRECSEKYIPF